MWHNLHNLQTCPAPAQPSPIQLLDWTGLDWQVHNGRQFWSPYIKLTGDLYHWPKHSQTNGLCEPPPPPPPAHTITIHPSIHPSKTKSCYDSLVIHLSCGWTTTDELPRFRRFCDPTTPTRTPSSIENPIITPLWMNCNWVTKVVPPS